MDIESFVSEALEQLGAGLNKARGMRGIKLANLQCYPANCPLWRQK